MGLTEMTYLRTIATAVQGFLNDMPPKVVLEQARAGSLPNSVPAGRNWTTGSNRLKLARALKGIYDGRHGGGAWKVAYADFVTAMMAFFLVMWITGQSKAVRQAIAQYFKDPWKTSAHPSGESSGGSPLLPSKPGQTPAGDRKHSGPYSMGHGQITPDPRAKNEDEAQEHRVSIRPNLLAVHDGNGRTVGVLLVFDEGSVELSDACKERLERLLPDYRGKPHKIEIRGHATQNSSTADQSAGRRLATLLCPLSLHDAVSHGARHRAGSASASAKAAPSNPIRSVPIPRIDCPTRGSKSTCSANWPKT